jgi:hypothetical protein
MHVNKVWTNWCQFVAYLNSRVMLYFKIILLLKAVCKCYLNVIIV